MTMSGPDSGWVMMRVIIGHVGSEGGQLNILFISRHDYLEKR